MNRSVTIVMYHFVRELAQSRYPQIKGLETSRFVGQLAYLKRHYTPISAWELMAAVAHGGQLPKKSLLLTFDDGYADHFTQVFPILDAAGISGAFFPAAKCLLEHTVLDVNKVHFILAATPDKTALVEELMELIAHRGPAHHALEPHIYRQRFAQSFQGDVGARFDSFEVLLIKRLLQRDLPVSLRQELINELFRRRVSQDEAAFSRELYMSLDQVACLRRHGHYIGSHGYEHPWFNVLSRAEQERDVALGLAFLNQVGAGVEPWIMCYPYGAYDASLLEILKKNNCIVGLTTRVDVANLDCDNPLQLSRLDTNDLPKGENDTPSPWTIAG